jgi:hypothetical protein
LNEYIVDFLFKLADFEAKMEADAPDKILEFLTMYKATGFIEDRELELCAKDGQLRSLFIKTYVRAITDLSITRIRKFKEKANAVETEANEKLQQGVDQSTVLDAANGAIRGDGEDLKQFLFNVHLQAVGKATERVGKYIRRTYYS